MGDQILQKNMIKNFVHNKINSANIPPDRKISKEQAELQRYNLTICNYRNILKQQSGTTLETVQFSVNLFEFALNLKYKNKKVGTILDIMFFNVYEELRKLGCAKQIDIMYEIKIYDYDEKKIYKETDIRKMNYELISNKEALVNQFAYFIQDTIQLADSCGLKIR